MLVSTILAKVRLELSDEDSTRWSDAQLTSIASDAQYDISYKTNCLHKSVRILTSANKNAYVLPSDTRLISKVSTLDRQLTIISREDLENLDNTWQERIGSPKYLVFDNLNRGVIKISPVPTIDTYLSIDYIYTPSELIDINSSFSIDDSYNLALINYIVYRALSSDSDTRDLGSADRYRVAYREELLRHMGESSKSFMDNSRGLSTHYQGFV